MSPQEITEWNQRLQVFVSKLQAIPNKDELDKTPDGKANTLPISYVEMTLDELFYGLWSTEKFTWSTITNEVVGSIELVLTHPITQKEYRRVGAAGIVITVDAIEDEIKKKMSKQERNEYANNPSNKKPNALDLAFPKLKAECVKNAAQSIGKILGRDLNRKKVDTLNLALKPLKDDAFLKLVERIEAGETSLVTVASDSFILTPIQLEIIQGAANGQKQLH